MTAQQPASGAIGATYKDKATLSNAVNLDGTGSITFTLYPARGCAGTPLDTETVTGVSANADYTTPTGVVLQNANTYFWVASFSGDTNNKSASTGCNDEAVVVAKNQPSIVTTQLPSSGAIGATYKDKATLSGAASLDGTGSITFTLYPAKGCTGTALDTETVSPVSANADYTTPTGVVLQNADTYYWAASFSGDSNNKQVNPSTADCNAEPVVVAKNQPSLVTSQQPASGAIGDTYKDTATLSGAANLDGSGSITFTLYPQKGCNGTALDTETVTGVSANADYTTPSGFQIENAGTYYWAASFSGDSNNKQVNPSTADCNAEPVVVAKNQPSLVTSQQPASGAIGDTYKDTATLSGAANLDGTGSITFTLYPQRGCNGTALDSETVTGVSANADYTTPTGVVLQNAGTYFWVASFSGDANNKSASTGCNDEPVVVAKNQPSIITTQQPASGAIGDTYKDTATLSGAVNLDGSGSITFNLYPQKGCNGTALDTETVTSVSANADYTTPTGFQIENAGTYYWAASFSGDSNNKQVNPSTADCNAEPVVVAKNQPSIITTQQPGSGAIGDTYKDTATLSGAANLDGSGSITFNLYPQRGCNGTALDTETVTGVSANADYTTPSGFQIENAGTYYWAASFSGDSNNKQVNPSTADCNAEPVVVAKNQPSIITTQQPASGAIGDTYKDTATLSGAANLDGSGSIIFTLYTKSSCSNSSALYSETVSPVSANADYTTPTGVALQNAGTYFWGASFSGDPNNKSVTADCSLEPVVVAKNQPSLATSQQPSSGAIGDTYKDTATLSGAASLDGSGSITFNLYPQKGCNGTALDSETVTGVSANADYTTPTGFQIENAGTYYWVASFSGDGNNKKVSTGCNDEPVVVAKASPSIATTQQPASGAIGDTYKDTATLSGAVNLDGSGSITFNLYPQKGCNGTALDTETVTGVSANADYTTPTGVALQNAGTYYWVASFSGDSNNTKVNPSNADCNAEPVVVAKNQPSLVTSQQPASGAIGDTYKDTATLSGAASLDGGGSITFTLYPQKGCNGTALDTETVTGVSANADYTTPTGVALQNAGTYYWVASFSGDSNNKQVSTGCNDEAVVVAKASPSIVTTQHPASGAIGATYKDTASLSGALSLDGSGSITFALYPQKGCNGTALDTETVTGVSANADYTTPIGVALQNAGTYYWVASFSGDANNKAASTGCNDESVVVAKASPSILTTQQPAGGAIGGTYKDNATLSGLASPDGTGSITFSLYGVKGCDGTPLDREAVTNVHANGSYTTPTGVVLQNAGTYYWVASFSGDSNNNASTSGCNDEPVVVAANSPSITTKLSQSAGNVGVKVHDSATLGNAVSNAGGTVTYTVYSDNACTDKVADGGTVNVTNGSAPNSNDVTFNTAGTYYWQASYSGDANNAPATSGCTDEQLVIAPLIDLAVTKSGSPSPLTLPGNITWTMVVTNNGPSPATGVTTSDPIPAGNAPVSVSTTQGSCGGAVILSCNLGTVAPGGSVTITLITTPSVAGTVTNSVTVVGNETETNTANNTASASVVVVGPHTPPTVFCVAVSKITPKQLFVGRKATLTLQLTQHGRAVKGVRVTIKGPKLSMRTKPSNARGLITQKLRPTKAGIVIFTPVASNACGTKRLGVTGVFTPPVTG